MSYIGNSPALKYASFAVQHFTTSATTSYSLDNSVANENDIALFVNNVRQQPGTSYAYTAAGTTLTLSAATTGSDTMYCVFIGKAVQTVVPPAGSVTNAMLSDMAANTVKVRDANSSGAPSDKAVATTEILIGDGTGFTAASLSSDVTMTNAGVVTIAAGAVTGANLNDDAISGQDALGAAPADTDEFLVSDAGTLKRVDYSYIKGITQSSFLPIAAPLIINGDMQVAQRGTSKTSISTGVHGYWTCDRFRERNDTGGTWTQTQESLTSGDALADGFANSLKMDNTTANASLSTTSRLYLNYAFEGQDVQVFKKGTANAEKYTVSFWVKATKTGTNILELWDNGGTTRHCCTAYTVSSTDTWEKKVVNFPADTTGVIADGNSDNFIMYFWLAAGTNYTSGTLATTWANTTAANSAVGQVNNADSTSNNFEITGVQLEVGEYTSSDLPPFRFESYGNNLRRCSRYFQVMARGLVGRAQTTTTCSVGGTFPMGQMRDSPTITLNADGLASSIQDPGVNAHTISNLEGNSSNYLGVFVKFLTSAATQVVGNVMVTNGNDNPLLLMDAEL